MSAVTDIIKFPKQKWLDIMLMFSERVEDECYYKIPYAEWKSLRDFDDEVSVVCSHERDNIYHMEVFPKGLDKDRWDYWSDDESFGEFLYWGFIVMHTGCVATIAGEPIIKLNLDNKNTNDTKKESNEMKLNFDFGPVNAEMVKMSLYGLAVKNKNNTWVSFDASKSEVVDVDILHFDGAKYLYKMPVAIKDIAVGDVVIHNHVPMFVIAIPADGKTLTAIDPIAGERKEILLTKSPFGFDFATKVVNLLGNVFDGCADAANPFGNLGMLMLLSDGNKDMNDLLPLMMLSGGKFDMSNPLMMYALLGNKGNNDMLPLLLLGSQGKIAFGASSAAPTQVLN
jgi:hypothetical protein